MSEPNRYVMSDEDTEAYVDNLLKEKFPEAWELWEKAHPEKFPEAGEGDSVEKIMADFPDLFGKPKAGG